MSTQTEKTKEQIAASSTVETALQRILSATDLAALGSSCFDDLGGIFQAIQELAPEHSTIQRLAGIGKYLAEDWSNIYDSEREQFDGHLLALTAERGERNREITN